MDVKKLLGLDFLLSLPSIKYQTINDIPLVPKELVSVNTCHAVVTNPTSVFPIPCTGGLLDCLAVIAINRKTNAVAVVHLFDNGYNAEALPKVIDLVRRPDSLDTIEFYFIGAGIDESVHYKTAQKWRERMEAIVDKLNELKHIKVIGFDVGKKPYPMGFAVKWQGQGYSIIRLTDLVDSIDSSTHPPYLGDSADYSKNGLKGLYIDGKMHDTFHPGIDSEIEALLENGSGGAYGNTIHPFLLTWDGRLPEHQAQNIRSLTKSDKDSSNWNRS